MPDVTETLSYDAQLDADIRSAVDTVEKGTPPAPEPAPAAPEPAAAEPAASEPATRSSQPRDEGGRFAKREGDDVRSAAGKREGDGAQAEPAPTAAQPPVAGQPGQEQAPAAAAPQSGPPPGWSVPSKAAWDALPEHVRADIAKREGEVQEGLAALRNFKDVQPYAEQAARSGTTLAAALQRYTTMESVARRDPARGMMAVAHNLGLSKDGAAKLFSDLAAALGARPTGAQSTGSQPHAGEGSDQNDPLAEVISPIIQRVLGPLTQDLSALKTHVTRQQEADQNAWSSSVNAAIAKFRTDPKYRYFSDLEDTISDLIESGQVRMTGDAEADLARAYDKAAWNHDQVREALINERIRTGSAATAARETEAAARAAAASRSITGSATAGAEPTQRRRAAGQSYDDDLMADVRAAAEAVSGRA
jgi:hypothetical protein